MTFSSQERTGHFDSYIASVDMALRNPTVGAVLGELATRLLEINEYAFLPNIQSSGRIKIPKKYQHTPNAIPIIPVSEDEAANIDELIAPILADMIDPPRPIGDYVGSSVSGVRMHVDELSRWAVENRPSVPVESYSSKPGKTVEAWTNIRSNVLSLEGICYDYTPTRPIIAVRAARLDGLDEWHKAAVVAHEEAHALDGLENAVLLQTPRGGMGSELVGYFVSDTLYEMSSADPQGSARRTAHGVELWRRNNLSPAQPFVPNDEQVNILQSWGI